jgi:glycosyltransferase involved in cell wall biosynthesis
MKRVAVIPALDEDGSIGTVVRELAAYVDEIVVVDNGSRDRTGEVARAAGAIVVSEPRRGYGAACIAGVGRASELGANVIVFLDGDGSDDPRRTPELLLPIEQGKADLVLGVRTTRSSEPGAQLPVQRFGNWLGPLLMRLFVGARYHDMPPFKAVTADALSRLALTDRGMGYIVEMLLRAHALGLRVVEIEVGSRARRTGRSKVSGTVVGSIRAGTKITTTIVRHAVAGARRRS